MDDQHVLIVEDDRVTALVISEFLTAHGYRTTVACNGREGVDCFLAECPDLVLCDALLPRLNGFDACATMRKSPLGPTVPIVMMSAFYRSQRQAMEHMPDLEIEDFLVKPFELEVLLDRVHALLPQ